jgi:hypothetical protein
MQHAQLVAFGVEGLLGEIVRELAQRQELWLRDVRHVKTCLSVLRSGGVGVLVLRLGKNLDQELALLEQVRRLFPATRTIVVGPADNVSLAALAWDLGAAYVLFPPQPVESIRDVLLGFLSKSDYPLPGKTT